MLRVAWSSVAPSHNSDPQGATLYDLDRLFAEWQAAPHKGDFIAALDLETAQTLTQIILERTPATYTPKKKGARHANTSGVETPLGGAT